MRALPSFRDETAFELQLPLQQRFGIVKPLDDLPAICVDPHELVLARAVRDITGFESHEGTGSLVKPNHVPVIGTSSQDR